MVKPTSSTTVSRRAILKPEPRPVRCRYPHPLSSARAARLDQARLVDPLTVSTRHRDRARSKAPGLRSSMSTSGRRSRPAARIADRRLGQRCRHRRAEDRKLIERDNVNCIIASEFRHRLAMAGVTSRRRFCTSYPAAIPT